MQAKNFVANEKRGCYVGCDKSGRGRWRAMTANGRTGSGQKMVAFTQTKQVDARLIGTRRRFLLLSVLPIPAREIYRDRMAGISGAVTRIQTAVNASKCEIVSNT